MSANARDLLARVSVFVDGFSRAAAETVVEPGSPTHEGLNELVRHSLVAFDGELDRFRMLDTIREYGQDSLAAMHAVDITRERQAEWLAQLIADSEAAFSSGRDRAVALDRADAERRNIRDALAWAVRGDWRHPRPAA
jgi:non-specific serine/threonine protein kinase